MWSGLREPTATGGFAPGELLLVAALVTGFPQKLAVLFLSHPLATLLDDRTHYSPRSRYGLSARPNTTC